jgi:LysM repeat protein
VTTIPDFPDYKITKSGVVTRITSRTNAVKGTVIKPQKMCGGYYYITLSKPGHGTKRFSHHGLVMQVFGKPKPTLQHQIAHKDGDNSNNSFHNLKWATPKENAAHKKSHGTNRDGESHPSSKLKSEDIKKILERRLQGESAESIAKDFSISSATIYRIEKGKNWKILKIKPVHANRTQGQHHHLSKLSDKNTLKIRKLIAAGIKGVVLARKFNVSVNVISNIKTGKTRKLK